MQWRTVSEMAAVGLESLVSRTSQSDVLTALILFSIITAYSMC